MERDAKAARGDRPFIFTNLKSGEGVDEVIAVDRARTAVRPLTANCERAPADIGRAPVSNCVRCRAWADRTGRRVRRAAATHRPRVSGGRRLAPDPGVVGAWYLRRRFAQQIVVEEGASVRLTSQSATQIHANEAGGLATLASMYRVDSGGHLECEWDPTIPFLDAKLDQKILIDSAHEATFLWSDALMAGREARGERWRFSQLGHELRLMRAGTLTYMERYSMTPATGSPGHRWIADEACYFGTVLAAGEAVNRSLVRDVHEKLQARSGVRASADLVEEQLLLLRLVGSEGTAFHQARALSTVALSTRSVRL